MGVHVLVTGASADTEPVSSAFLTESEAEQVSATGVGRLDPAATGGYLYRDATPPSPLGVVPELPVSNVYDLEPESTRAPAPPGFPNPEALPLTAWSGDGQRGAPDQVPYASAFDDTGAWGLGAMPYPSEYGISELVSVTPDKFPILLGPAGKMGMGWPQTVTTPPWIDIGDQTPADVIGLGAGVGIYEGSIGPSA